MTTPRRRIEAACARRGRGVVVAACVAALGGRVPDDDLLVVLGGDHGRGYLDGVPPGHEYWIRVWGARGLLWAGPADAAEPVRAALGDEHWRVREMTCKVVARHLLGDLLADVAAMRTDPVVRVRTAATRAVEALVAADA